MIYLFLPSASCAIFAGETVAKNSLACYYKQRHTEIVQRQKTFLTGMKKRRAPPPPCKKSLLNFPPPLLCRRHRGCNEKFPFLRVLQYVPAFLARDKSRRAILLPGKAASVIPPPSSPFKDQTEKEERDDLTAGLYAFAKFTRSVQIFVQNILAFSSRSRSKNWRSKFKIAIRSSLSLLYKERYHNFLAFFYL